MLSYLESVPSPSVGEWPPKCATQNMSHRVSSSKVKASTKPRDLDGYHVQVILLTVPFPSITIPITLVILIAEIKAALWALLRPIRWSAL